MKLIRFFEISLKLLLCLPFKRFFIIRIIFFPFHLLLFPKLTFTQYGKRLSFLLESLGGVFVKLGQSLSLKSFLFEKNTIKALSYLQDSIPPINLNILEYIQTINPKLANHNGFSIEAIPIASASIAQVYKGVLNGNSVVFKIVKPNIKKQIEKDFAIILFIGKIVNRFCSPALQLLEVIESIHQGVLLEVNLLHEMENIKKMRRSLILESNITLPRTCEEFSNELCLVLSFCEGISVRKVIYENGVNKNILARNILECYLQQVYENGIFHADMHAGNILVQNDGSIALIDFGLIDEISQEDRTAVAGLIYAFLKNNPTLATQIQLNAGYISQEVYYNYQYHFAMKNIAKKFSENFQMSQFSHDLFQVMHQFNVFIPKHLLLLNKTILYIEDILQQLSPSFKALDVINPWIQKWYYKNKIKDALLTFKNTIKQHEP